MKGANTKVIGEPLKVGGKKMDITCVSMGNPHYVTFVDNVESFPVEKVGPEMENHPSFPQRTNVEFVEIIDKNQTRQRTWERGAGETLACGTGSCASVVAGVLNDRLSRKVTVHLRGGDLLIEWMGDNRVHMTGPAEDVFEGDIFPEQLKKWVEG
jgi:diaminopimelate epimerase